MAVINIFSGSFCNADEIIETVSSELNFAVVNDRLFEETTKRFEITRDKLEGALTGQEPLLDKFTRNREKYLAYLKIVLADIIQEDNQIVLGCPGHLIPRTISHVLRVCLIANHDFRIKQAVEKAGISEKDAGKLIHEDDKNNFACTEFLFDKTAYDKTLYDIVLPMQDSTIEEAVKTICDYARSEPIKSTDRSKQAAKDFILSARVNLALAEAGMAADVHSENGQVILSINQNVLRLNKYREKLAEVAQKVEGVTGVNTRLGPRYKAQSVNPWSNIDGPPKIMLVDDEKEFVHTLSERLRTRNLDASIAYDGEQALDMLKDDVPDVMVLDLMMPGIDGIETLRRIKAQHPKVEVIILTGHGSSREKQMAEELGAFAYLRKPVDIDTLTRVMREAYGRTGKADSSEIEKSDE